VLVAGTFSSIADRVQVERKSNNTLASRGTTINVRPFDREQLFLMPPSVSEWLPDGHLAWFVLDVVSELDLAGFYAGHREDGRGGAVYDPGVMLAILIYSERLRRCRARVAALAPHIPWAPGPGGVAAEQRYVPGRPVA
jgi:hypothetical protein